MHIVCGQMVASRYFFNFVFYDNTYTYMCNLSPYSIRRTHRYIDVLLEKVLHFCLLSLGSRKTVASETAASRPLSELPSRQMLTDRCCLAQLGCTYIPDPSRSRGSPGNASSNKHTLYTSLCLWHCGSPQFETPPTLPLPVCVHTDTANPTRCMLACADEAHARTQARIDASHTPPYIYIYIYIYICTRTVPPPLPSLSQLRCPL